MERLSSEELGSVLRPHFEAVGVQSVRNRRNCTKYIPKEDFSPIYNVSKGNLHFNVLLFDWLKTTRRLSCLDPFVVANYTLLMAVEALKEKFCREEECTAKGSDWTLAGIDCLELRVQGYPRSWGLRSRSPRYYMEDKMVAGDRNNRAFTAPALPPPPKNLLLRRAGVGVHTRSQFRVCVYDYRVARSLLEQECWSARQETSAPPDSMTTLVESSAVSPTPPCHVVLFVGSRGAPRPRPTVARNRKCRVSRELHANRAPCLVCRGDEEQGTKEAQSRLDLESGTQRGRQPADPDSLMRRGETAREEARSRGGGRGEETGEESGKAVKESARELVITWRRRKRTLLETRDVHYNGGGIDPRTISFPYRKSIQILTPTLMTPDFQLYVLQKQEFASLDTCASWPAERERPRQQRRIEHEGELTHTNTNMVPYSTAQLTDTVSGAGHVAPPASQGWTQHPVQTMLEASKKAVPYCELRFSYESDYSFYGYRIWDVTQRIRDDRGRKLEYPEKITSRHEQRRGRGGIVVRLLASQVGDSGSIPGRCRWSARFLGDLPFPPPLHSGAAPYRARYTLIGSLDSLSRGAVRGVLCAAALTPRRNGRRMAAHVPGAIALLHDSINSVIHRSSRWHREIGENLDTQTTAKTAEEFEVNMKQYRNVRARETGDIRENQPISDIVRYDSIMRKSRSNPAGNRTRFTLMGGENGAAVHETCAGVARSGALPPTPVAMATRAAGTGVEPREGRRSMPLTHKTHPPFPPGGRSVMCALCRRFFPAPARWQTSRYLHIDYTTHRPVSTPRAGPQAGHAHRDSADSVVNNLGRYFLQLARAPADCYAPVTTRTTSSYQNLAKHTQLASCLKSVYLEKGIHTAGYFSCHVLKYNFLVISEVVLEIHCTSPYVDRCGHREKSEVTVKQYGMELEGRGGREGSTLRKFAATYGQSCERVCVSVRALGQQLHDSGRDRFSQRREERQGVVGSRGHEGRPYSQLQLIPRRTAMHVV
ncbi:hypothetical protein PR048_017296 [Dryococelus australis]|uniref:Uncharacterized protein n=1 Tax=Dryococelus australis TaxID=614101 RepID=A0ABQ9H9B8_9NEOP|nr:hypothetical protein PR048_017296 [Dryococelus australis]